MTRQEKKLYRQAYYQKNKVRLSKKSSVYYKKNKKKILVNSKEWQQSEKGKQSHKDSCKRYDASEKGKATTRKWRRSESGKLSAKRHSKIEQQRDPKYFAAMARMRASKEYKKLKSDIRRQRYCCRNDACRSVNDLVLYHKKPIKDGGTNDKKNLSILCRTCAAKEYRKYQMSNKV